MATIPELLTSMAESFDNDNKHAFRRNLEEFNKARKLGLELLTDTELMQKMCDLRAKMSEAHNDSSSSYYAKEAIRYELNQAREELKQRIW